MKRVHWLPLAILAFSLSSCVSSSSLPISVFQGIVTASSGKLISDEGDEYTLVNSQTEYPLDSGRYMVSCDVLRKTGGHRFEAVLNGIVKAEGSTVLKKSEASPEDLADDPLDIGDVWISGGYVNMRNTCISLKDSPTSHLVNLVFDDIASKEDSLFFYMCHNSFGEKPDNDEHKSKTFLVRTYYSSYNLDGVIPHSHSNRVITIRWCKYSDYEKFNVEKHSASHSFEY